MKRSLVKLAQLMIVLSFGVIHLHSQIISTFEINTSAHGDSAIVYVVLGSSTAEGIGASTADSSWVGRFRSHVQRFDASARIINFAVGGYTTYDIMPSNFMPPADRPTPKVNNNISLALSYKPTAILINMPSNDAARNFTIEEQIRNFRVIIGLIEAQGIPYRVTTTQPRNLNAAGRRSLQIMRDSILAIFNRNAINIFDEMADSDGSLKSSYDSGDGIHVNNRGHQYIFNQIIGSGILDSLRTNNVGRVGKPATFLKQNFPNPARDITHIRYHLPEAGRVEMNIYDTQGRLIQQLVNETQLPGSYQISWDTQTLCPGAYYYSIALSGKRFVCETMKTMVVK